MRLARGIFITKRLEEFISKLKELQRGEKLTIIDSGDGEFLIEHAVDAISKAFIATKEIEFITLVSPKFSILAQNKLLKIIEEPPLNKEFIIVTKSKSSLLPTIKSRLPITTIDKSHIGGKIELNINNLSLKEIYNFSKQNSHISSLECKELIENLSLSIMKSKRNNIDNSILKIFSDSIKALDLGSPTSFVLNVVLLKLLNHFGAFKSINSTSFDEISVVSSKKVAKIPKTECVKK